MFSVFKDLAGTGVPNLLVVQNAVAALTIVARAYRLRTGRVIMPGAGTELLGERDLICSPLRDKKLWR